MKEVNTLCWKQGQRQRQEAAHESEGQQPQQPAWLASSQKWLKSAGKKVAQAAKETTATLQARLEELEGRAGSHKGACHSVMCQQMREHCHTSVDLMPLACKASNQQSIVQMHCIDCMLLNR